MKLALPLGALALSLIMTNRVLADDFTNSIAAGGFSVPSAPHLALKEEQIHLSLSRTEMNGVFVNEGSSPIAEDVSFHVPRYVVEPSGTRIPKMRRPRVIVNGGLRQTVRDVSCYVVKDKHEVDIAKDLHAVFKSDLADIDAIAKEADQLSTAKQDDLVKRGWFRVDREGLRKAEMWPLWQTAVVYRWHQTFSPGQKTKISMSYQTDPGRSVYAGNCFDEEKFTVCSDDATRDAVIKLANDESHRAPAINCRWIDFNLMSEFMWKEAIPSFEIIVDKPSSKAFYNTCFEGFKPDGKNHIRFKAKDYKPDQDLRMFFYSR